MDLALTLCGACTNLRDWPDLLLTCTVVFFKVKLSIPIKSGVVLYACLYPCEVDSLQSLRLNSWYTGTQTFANKSGITLITHFMSCKTKSVWSWDALYYFQSSYPLLAACPRGTFTLILWVFILKCPDYAVSWLSNINTLQSVTVFVWGF